MSARNFVQTLGAGETISLPGGRYFYIRTASSALDIKLRGNAGSPVQFIGIGAGSKFGPVAEGEGWRFTDITSAAAQAIEVIISDDGNFEVASTVTVSGSVTTAEAPASSLTSTNSAVVASGTNLDIAANLSRRRLTICNDSSSTASVYIRDTTGTGAAGIELQPGMFVELKNTAGVRVRNNSAVGVNIMYLEEA